MSAQPANSRGGKTVLEISENADDARSMDSQISSGSLDAMDTEKHVKGDEAADDAPPPYVEATELDLLEQACIRRISPCKTTLQKLLLLETSRELEPQMFFWHFNTIHICVALELLTWILYLLLGIRMILLSENYYAPRGYEFTATFLDDALLDNFIMSACVLGSLFLAVQHREKYTLIAHGGILLTMITFTVFNYCNLPSLSIKLNPVYRMERFFAAASLITMSLSFVALLSYVCAKAFLNSERGIKYRVKYVSAAIKRAEEKKLRAQKAAKARAAAAKRGAKKGTQSAAKSSAKPAAKKTGTTQKKPKIKIESV